MASLQEIQGNLISLHQSLEQGKGFLLGNANACKQYANQIQASIEGTAYSEYSQIMSILQCATDSIGKALLAINGTEAILESWTQEKLGVSLRGISYQSTVMQDTDSLLDSSDTEQASGSPRLLNQEEVNNRWQSIVQTTDEVVDNYRDALIGLGIPAGKLLNKFLQGERAKMLKYEAAVLDQASGHGEVSDADKYIYRIAGAAGEYGYDTLAKEYGLFCLNDASGWIKDINPNFYNPFILPSSNPYHVNCGSCAFAVDTRLSGGDDLVASKTNIGSDFAMEVATGKQCVYMPMEEIEDFLRSQGPGSHVIVGINRGPAPNGCPQSGHWFNAFFDGENFHTIDGQSGEILDWPYDYGDVTEWCALV